MHLPTEVMIFDDNDSRPRLVLKVMTYDGEGRPIKIRIFSPVNPLIPLLDLEGVVLKDFSDALNSLMGN